MLSLHQPCAGAPRRQTKTNKKKTILNRNRRDAKHAFTIQSLAHSHILSHLLRYISRNLNILAARLSPNTKKNGFLCVLGCPHQQHHQQMAFSSCLTSRLREFSDTASRSSLEKLPRPSVKRRKPFLFVGFRISRIIKRREPFLFLCFWALGSRRRTDTDTDTHTRTHAHASQKHRSS